MSFLSSLAINSIPLVGSLIGNIFNKKSTDSTNDKNMRLAQYQYEKNLEMWNRSNEYNTPLNQRKRIEAAGFNPNLVYGHGSLANTTSNYPEYNAPHIQRYQDFGDMGTSSAVQSFLYSQQQEANIKNTNQQTKNLVMTNKLQALEIQQKNLDIIYAGYRNSKSEAEANIWLDMLESKMDLIDKQAQGAFSQSMLNDRKRIQIEKWEDAERAVNLDVLKKKLDLSDAELANIKARTTSVIANLGLTSEQITRLRQENWITKYLIENRVNLKETGKWGFFIKLGDAILKKLGINLDLSDFN